MKESIIPYAKKQFKLAKMNHDLYGGAGMSPTEEEKPGKRSSMILTFEEIQRILNTLGAELNKLLICVKTLFFTCIDCTTSIEGGPLFQRRRI